MVTYTAEMYQKLHNSEPADVAGRKEELMKTLNELQSRPLLGLFNDNRVAELEQLVAEGNWNFVYLQSYLKITQDDVNSICELAKFYYEIGQYDRSSSLLRRFMDLNEDPQREATALWGKIASDLVMSKWDDVLDDFAKLETLIESSGVAPIKQLQQRIWIAHWSLFTFFQIPRKETFYLDLCLGSDKYNQVVSIKAPWLLRYLSIVAIIHKHRLKEVVQLVEQESANFSDPITRFVYALYSKFDFKAAEHELSLCAAVLEQDYFVSTAPATDGVSLKDRFLEGGKLAICEAYCKIHSTIDIGMMAKKLGKTNEESERWIVNLIRNSKLDAKIDSAKNQVIVSCQVPNAYQLLLEKTKSLTLRAGVLSSNAEKNKTQPK